MPFDLLLYSCHVWELTFLSSSSLCFVFFSSTGIVFIFFLFFFFLVTLAMYISFDFVLRVRYITNIKRKKFMICVFEWYVFSAALFWKVTMLNSLVMSVFVLGDAESLALNIFSHSHWKQYKTQYFKICVLRNVLSLGVFPKATGVICRVLLSVVVIDNSEPLCLFLFTEEEIQYMYISRSVPKCVLFSYILIWKATDFYSCSYECFCY